MPGFIPPDYSLFLQETTATQHLGSYESQEQPGDGKEGKARTESYTYKRSTLGQPSTAMLVLGCCLTNGSATVEESVVVVVVIPVGKVYAQIVSGKQLCGATGRKCLKHGIPAVLRSTSFGLRASLLHHLQPLRHLKHISHERTPTTYCGAGTPSRIVLP